MAEDLQDLLVWSLPMRTRFRGIDVREGVLLRGDAGWGEFSPFWDYDAAECVPWLAAAREAADVGWPAPVRTSVPVNVTVPAVGPDGPRPNRPRLAGCRTAKVKVAEPGQTEADDLARVEAVRDALGPDGAVRVDANGALGRRHRRADGAAARPGRRRLEYVEQPCRTVEELAAVRRRVDVPGRGRRVDPPGRRPAAGGPAGGGRHRGAQGAAARRRRGLPAHRRADRPAGGGVVGAGDVGRASPPGSRWPPRCPSCRTPAGWRPWPCSTAT